jgi:hypothetical protein
VEQFDAEKWAKLTVPQQIECCRKWAAEAQALANKSTPNVKSVFDSVARTWLDVATKLERAALDHGNPLG